MNVKNGLLSGQREDRGLDVGFFYTSILNYSLIDSKITLNYTLKQVLYTYNKRVDLIKMLLILIVAPDLKYF